jgi:hypothetical protein
MNRSNALRLVLVAALAAIAALALPSLAAAKHRDRNHDRIPDRWEKRHKLSLNVNQAGRDQDGDRLRNRAEFLAEDNPRDTDSDNDGVEDGEENAGKIVSFDPVSGKLVIGLFGGDTVSGLVTAATEIECHHGDSATTSSDGQSGEDESGEDGPGGGDEAGDADSGEEEPGDNNGSQEEESGDNNDGQNGPGGEAGHCTTADLTEGATVKEAELKLEGGNATFEKVELAG